MHTVFGIWGPLDLQFGGISKCSSNQLPNRIVADVCNSSFLVKDAQQDIAGERLKA